LKIIKNIYKSFEFSSNHNSLANKIGNLVIELDDNTIKTKWLKNLVDNYFSDGEYEIEVTYKQNAKYYEKNLAYNYSSFASFIFWNILSCRKYFDFACACQRRELFK
jgi:hypothetical protein